MKSYLKFIVIKYNSKQILKTLTYIGFIFLLIFCNACKEQNNKVGVKEKDNTDKEYINDENEQYHVDVNNLLEHMPVLLWKRDSIAEANHENYYNEDGSDSKPFIEKHEKFVLDTMVHNEQDQYIPLDISINKGQLFDQNFVHSIVGIGDRRDIYCRNVFESDFYHELIEEDKYSRVVQADIEIPVEKDSIFDVNGDGYKDYAMVLYSMNGCCRRDVYRVYLYLPHCGGFTPYYEFMNPTFYPKEKMIPGIYYGHPGEIGLYEQKWDDLLLKTTLELYPNFRDSLHFTYLQYENRDSIDQKPTKILKKLPQQFEKITSIEWFKDYQPKDFAEMIREMAKNIEKEE